MRAAERWLFAVALTTLLAAPVAWFELRSESGFAGQAPDLAAIAARAPAGWQVLPVSDNVVSPSVQASYDQVLMRRFARRDGEEITLVLTWSRDGRLRAGHDQQVCYRAQGFVIASVGEADLPLANDAMKAIAFSGRRGDLVEDVMYWRITGGEFESGGNIWRHRLNEIGKTITGNIPDGLMVRVSSRRPADAPASTVNAAFVQAFFKSLTPAERAQLAGR